MANKPGLVQFQPHAAINNTITVTIAADNVPQALPPVRVPPGIGVTLRARAANVQSVYASLYIEHLSDGQGREIVPGGISGSAISFPVDHLGQIWIKGKKGDVISAEISGVPIG